MVKLTGVHFSQAPTIKHPSLPSGVILVSPTSVYHPPTEIRKIHIDWDLYNRFKGAITRPLRMLARPIGIMELFVHMIPGLQWVSIPLIISKHAFEGFFKVDGIFGKRDWAKYSPFNVLSGARQHGRSFIDLLRGKPEHWETMTK